MLATVSKSESVLRRKDPTQAITRRLLDLVPGDLLAKVLEKNVEAVRGRDPDTEVYAGIYAGQTNNG